MSSLTFDQLRTVSLAGGVLGVSLQAIGDAFFVRVTTRNNTQATLSRARSTESRAFRNPTLAIALLHKLGITVGSFDATQWTPGLSSSRRTRPDRAEAMQQAKTALANDQWFRAQVVQGLAEADDPNTPWLSLEQAKASWAAKSAALLRRARASGASAD